MGATPALLESVTGTVTRDASYANADVWLSTHSADPGSSGANELTSGTGVEGRQQITFISGGSGADSNNVAGVITIPGTQTIPWYGLWTAQTGGTFLGGYPAVEYPYLMGTGIDGSETLAVPGHGLSVNDAVRLFVAPNAQSAIPSGLVADLVYYVVTVVDADDIQVSATLDGGAITLTGSGAFFLAQDATQAFSSGGGLLTFSIGNVIYSTVS